MYKIQGTDGRQYGPVSAEVARQWISQGRIAAATLIQAEGTADWRPASQFAEFADAFSASPPPAPTPRVTPPLPSAVTPTSAEPPKTSGLAIASLVLGILTIPTCGLGGILGLILGIVALVNISNSQGRRTGKGMAITGLCLSCFFLFLAPGFLLPALAKAKSRAQRINCVNNMKQIGIASRLWATDHAEKLPRDYLAMSNELGSPLILVCPSDTRRDRRQYTDWSAVRANGSSYELVSPGGDPARPQEVFARCPIHNNVLLNDGSVQQLPGGRRP